MTLDLRGLILIFVLATTPSAKGQAGSPESSQLNMRVARFELANETLFDGLSKLGSEGISLGIALEEVLKEKESDSPLAEPRSSIILQHRTVREILDILCTVDARYTWSFDGGIVNVYPKATIGDPSYLLDQKLDKISLVDTIDADDALTPISQKLPQQQIGYSQMGGAVMYSKPWSTTFENLTVRQVVNRIALHLGARGGWIVAGSREQRMFSFHRTEFSRAR